MGLILLEALAALVVLLGIVWWTMFSGRPGGEPPGGEPPGGEPPGGEPPGDAPPKRDRDAAKDQSRAPEPSDSAKE